MAGTGTDSNGETSDGSVSVSNPDTNINTFAAKLGCMSVVFLCSSTGDVTEIVLVCRVRKSVK